jgi:hypothetical protein
MPNLSLRRKTAILLLGLALALPWRATAAPHREPARRAATIARSPLDLAGRFWSLFVSLWGKTGCYIDPNGRCVASPAAAVTEPADTGCYIDPDGCRSAQPTALTAPLDTGCQIDPDGCRANQPIAATAPVDEGCYIDPNGCHLR